MNRFKKMLSLLLAALMLLAVVPIGAMAKGAAEAEVEISSAEVPSEDVRGDYSSTTLEAMTTRAEALVNYRWTPSTDIDTWNGNPYNGSTVFHAGSTVVGVPYTLFTSEVVSWSLCSLEQYSGVSASNYSTTHYCDSVSANRTGPVYGSCCVDLVCEVFGGSFMYGSSPRYHNVTSIKNSPYATTVYSQKMDDIRPGDAVSNYPNPGHIIWVGDVTDTQLTIYEQTPPVARKVVLDKASCTDANGYFVYNGSQYSVITRSNEAPKSEDYRAWMQSDSRWGGITMGSSGKTISAVGCLVTTVTKLIIQAGFRDSSSFNVATLANWLNSNNGYDGANLYWSKPAQMISGLSYYGGLCQDSSSKSSSAYNSQILQWIRDGYHMAICVKSGGHWVAVDEAKSLATGTVYIMDSINPPGADITLAGRYSTFTRIQAYRGGTTGSGGTNLNYSVDNSYPTPFNCRYVGPDGVYTYDSPGGSSVGGSLSYNDNCVINEVYTNGWCKVTYPTSNGDKTRYINLESFVPVPNTIFEMDAPAKANTYYNYDGANYVGYVDPGDHIWVLSEYGSMAQIIYPSSATSTGKRCAWAYLSDLGLGNRDPIGVLDGSEGGSGKFRVRGWVFDPDMPSASIEVHVYCGSDWVGKFTANESSPDVNSAYGITGDHRFDCWLTTSKRGSNTFTLYAISIDANGNGGYNNPAFASPTVTISPLTYTVSYNANGGTGAPASQTKTENVTLTLSSQIPSRTGYTFVRWNTKADGSGANYEPGPNGKYTANADATLYAQWQINTYTVTFKDWDGTVLKTQTVNYGGAATAPSNPSRTGYTFTGWDKAFNNITSNLVVTATYTINTYTVTFKDWDGTVLKTQTVNHGSAATAPANPSRTGYTFAGWDKAFNNVTSNLVVNATYTINTYTVTFLDWVGVVLETQTVEYGSDAIPPMPPEIIGHTFTGWSGSYTNVTEDRTVTATYDVNVYTLSIYLDGELFDIVCLAYGADIILPEINVEGYTFYGWYPDVGYDVPSLMPAYDLTVYGSLIPNEYVVTIYCIDADTGAAIAAAVDYSLSYGEGYCYEAPEFYGWVCINPEDGVGVVLGDTDIEFLYVRNVFTVTYVGDYEGTEEVVYGENAVLPVLEVPGLHYTFTVDGQAWDGTNIISDVTVTVGMEIDVYTVEFVDGVTGEVISSEFVEYADPAAAPRAPEHYGYTFAGWDVEFDCITADTVVTALYTPVEFTVIFTDGLDNIISVQEVPYLSAAVEPEIPVREGWVFAGWDADFSCIETSMVINATWERLYLTVTFTGSYNGTEVVEYGSDCILPVYNSTSICYTFKVNGEEWCPENITEDVTVTVSVAPVKTTYHTVTFIGLNGEVISTESVQHGQAAAIPEAPVVPGYRFVGWDRSVEMLSAVTYSCTRYAIYEETDEPGPQGLVGDANGDGVIAFADVAALYGMIFSGGAFTPEQQYVCDVNGDGTVSFADVAALYNYVFTGETA